MGMKKGKKKMKGKKGGKKGGDKKLVLKEKEMEAGFEKMMKGDDEPDEKDMKEMKKKWDGMSDDEKTMAKEAMKGKMKVMAEEEKGGPLTEDEEKELDEACKGMDKDFDGAMKKMKKGKKKMKGKKGGKKGGKKDKKLVLKEKEMEAGFEKMMK